MSPTLHTPRLTLTAYTPADEERFMSLFADEDVARWMGDGPQPADVNRAIFTRIFDVYAQRRFDVWGVWRDGQYVGHAELKPSPNVPGHELVYALARPAWGRGIGTEVAEAIISYGADRLGLTEVFATVALQNTASLTLLTRLGFGHLRDIEEEHGAVTRVLVRSLENEQAQD